jgi:phosphoglycolate phosphatase-like HAD superfamily hydrolase
MQSATNSADSATVYTAVETPELSTGVDTSPLQAATLDFLQELTQTQQQLLQVLEEKESALIVARWSVVRQLDQREATLQTALRNLIQRRSELLRKFHQAGIAGQTLQETLRNSSWQQLPEFRSAVKEAVLLADRLQQQGWSLWVLTQRAGKFYEQILGLISQGGQESPCYQQHPHLGTSPGGSLLDASI